MVRDRWNPTSYAQYGDLEKARIASYTDAPTTGRYASAFKNFNANTQKLVIAILMNGPQASEKLKSTNAMLYLVPEFRASGNTLWKCTGKLAGGDDIPAKYLPSSCKDSV